MRNCPSLVRSFGFAVLAPLRFTIKLRHTHYKVGTSLLGGLRRSIMPRSGRGGSDSSVPTAMKSASYCFFLDPGSWRFACLISAPATASAKRCSMHPAWPFTTFYACRAATAAPRTTKGSRRAASLPKLCSFSSESTPKTPGTKPNDSPWRKSSRESAT